MTAIQDTEQWLSEMTTDALRKMSRHARKIATSANQLLAMVEAELGRRPDSSFLIGGVELQWFGPTTSDRANWS